MNHTNNFKDKYLKYKKKYLDLKSNIENSKGGFICPNPPANHDDVDDLTPEGFITCPICLENKDNLVKVVPCCHIFCFDCAVSSFARKNPPKCPICRTEVSSNWYYNEKNKWIYNPE